MRLQQKIQNEKLEGQVLQHRTGKLIGSIHVLPIQLTGSQLVCRVEGAGGPAWYGQLHEYGGTFQVKEHLRRIGFNRKGEVVQLLTKSGAVRKRVASIKEGEVKAHSITFPERSFMRVSLEEIASEMIADLQKTAGISVQ